jgi:hypothetical protein
MRRIFLLLIGAAAVLSAFNIPAYGGLARTQLPRNISIEVEFKEVGQRTKRIKGLKPYQKISDSQYTKQHIVVSDGLTATIRMGEDVPYIEYYTRYLHNHGYVEEIGVTFREVGTKLLVSPKIRGNYIEISLTPQISCLSEGRRDVINIQELTTTVMAADGQSISIGGLIKDEEFKGYFLKTNTASNLDIILTPHIQ